MFCYAKDDDDADNDDGDDHDDDDDNNNDCYAIVDPLRSVIQGTLTPYSNCSAVMLMLMMTTAMMLLQVEEFIMLTNPKLSLLNEDQEDTGAIDSRPQHKITQFR